jgi:hypothetical protein
MKISKKAQYATLSIFIKHHSFHNNILIIADIVTLVNSITCKVK